MFKCKNNIILLKKIQNFNKYLQINLKRFRLFQQKKKKKEFDSVNLYRQLHAF